MKKQKDYTMVLWLIIAMMLFGVTCCNAAAATPVAQIHATIVERDSTVKADEKVGTITVKKNDGTSKTYDLYRGKRGGYYYFTGKTTKEGKPERKYLTKKQKEENGLK